MIKDSKINYIIFIELEIDIKSIIKDQLNILDEKYWLQININTDLGEK